MASDGRRSDTRRSCWEFRAPFLTNFASSPKRSCDNHHACWRLLIRRDCYPMRFGRRVQRLCHESLLSDLSDQCVALSTGLQSASPYLFEIGIEVSELGTRGIRYVA